MSNDLKGVVFDNEIQPKQSGVVMTNDGLVSVGNNIRENQWDTGVTAQQFYVVKLNGMVASSKYPTRFLAEQHLVNLPAESRLIAEVVTVDKFGKELLLG